jgi:hypothetical protein
MIIVLSPYEGRHRDRGEVKDEAPEASSVSNSGKTKRKVSCQTVTLPVKNYKEKIHPADDIF